MDEKTNYTPEQEKALKLSVLPLNELAQKIDELQSSPNLAVALLLKGDRISCCDEGVVAEQNGKLVGVATIAPHGEMSSGQPTIVALYVIPEARRHGYGQQILQATIKRCQERGFEKIKIDSTSSHIPKIISTLPEDMRSALDVNDMGNILDGLS